MTGILDRFQGKRKGTEMALQTIRDKFTHFRALLDRNHQVLEIISDMEEKSQGDYLFDLNYIRSRLADLRSGVSEIIERVIALGGERYEPLRDRFSLINGAADMVLPGNRPIQEDSYTRAFERLGRMHSFSVGSKNAQLGEMKSTLGLCVPDGFAITAWAYKHFIDANDLQKRISRRIDSLDIRCFEDLVRVSKEIRDIVTATPVPDDLAIAIRRSCADLARRSAADRFSLRSSAIGEDTLFSFAGQYASYLNVRSDELVERYREVLASKFTPQAIYYFLSHSLSESELAMSVGCVAMVDAAAAGVAYTRCPVDPTDDAIVINSIFGLGRYLVNGTLTPDVFYVSRKDGKVRQARISNKPVQLVVKPDGGTREEAVPEAKRSAPSIEEHQLERLTECAVRLEEHYGRPQDIEWVIDRNGRLFFLQTRPLQIMAAKSDAVLPDLSKLETLVSGGATVCHGAGIGNIHHVTTVKDLPAVPVGAVLVAPNPFPGLITAMGKINALVTRVGGIASHMATIAREYGIPTLGEVDQALELPSGRMVTVDATGTAIYAGDLPDLVAARRPECEHVDDGSIFNVLGRVLDLVSPLRLLHPDDDDFLVENCVTFHDITRYAHQKAMDEMFSEATSIVDRDKFALRLKSDISMKMNIIYIDRDHQPSHSKGGVSEDDIGSLPMKAFWAGVKKEGYPEVGLSANVGGGREAMGTNVTEHTKHEYSETSFAILSDEYAMLCLRMGYHFSTVEAMASPNLSKNYIRMQFKYGGASLERRMRRVKLIAEILRRLDFDCQYKTDFMDAIASYKDAKAICDRLYVLGRLTIMTKQLDMALSSDQVAQWYTRDFLKKLGMEADREVEP